MILLLGWGDSIAAYDGVHNLSISGNYLQGREIFHTTLRVAKRLDECFVDGPTSMQLFQPLLELAQRQWMYG